MKKIYLLLLILTSCTSSNFDFINISEFRFKENALKENELVEIMYCSGEPDFNNDQKYYIHYIVISQVTGDTVNVLSTSLTDGISETNRIFNYQGENSVMNKILQNLNEMDKNGGTIDPNDLTTKRLDRVVTNSKLSWSGANNFPTVIGVLATQTKPPRDSTGTAE